VLGGGLALVLLGAASAIAAPHPGVEPKADEILHRFCDRLKEAKQFRFQVQESFDNLLESGQKVQLSNRRMVAVRRPNRLYGEISGDTSNRRVYYNGDTLTLFETDRNVYGATKARADIDATLDYVFKTYGISVPLADLVFSDPYQVMMDNVKTGTYQGIHQVGEFKCHHLAFTQETADWQAWIDAGEQPLLRKFVITYKQLPGQPQYVAVLNNWELSADLPDTTFRFTPPQGAMKIEILPVPAGTTAAPTSSKP